MAVDRLADYLNEIGGLLANYRHRERVVEEVADHLRERVEALIAAGRSESDATEEALAAFGDPHTYVESFSMIVAMPTTLTRWSGLAGLCGPFALLAAGLAEGEDAGQVPWLLLVPLVLIVSGFIGVIVRTKGSFGRLRGWTASTLIVAGAMIGSTSGWGVTGIACSIAVLAGVTLLLQTTFRVGALPRPATLTTAVAGVALAAMIGSDMKEQSAPVYMAGAALFIGWCWLQYTLWSERATAVRST